MPFCQLYNFRLMANKKKVKKTSVSRYVKSSSGATAFFICKCEILYKTCTVIITRCNRLAAYRISFLKVQIAATVIHMLLQCHQQLHSCTDKWMLLKVFRVG